MVEVGHYHHEAVVFLAEEVGDGDLGGVEFDVGGCCRGGVGGFDEFGFDRVGAGDEDDGEALGGLAAGDEVVGEHAVGDPLLGAVDDVVFTVGGFGRGGAESGDVGPGKGFGDGEAHEFLAGEAFLRDAVAERGVVGPLPDGGEGDHHPREVAVLEAAGVGAGEFLRDDHVGEVVEVFAGDIVEQFPTFHVFAGAEPCSKEVVRCHLVD